MNIAKELAAKYTEGDQLVPDNIYDDIIDLFVTEGMDEVTAEKLVGDMEKDNQNKVPLPKQMMSMTKVQTEKEFNNWKNKFSSKSSFNVSSKMDGISLLISGDLAFTRGDSKRGAEVSWIKKMLNIPSTPEGIMVRGELILNSEGWSLMQERDPSLATNPLNFISGFSHSINPNTDYLEYIDFVAFQLIDGENVEKSPTEQFELLEEMGYDVVDNKVYTNLKFDQLQNILDQYRKKSKYVLDGIIITEDREHPRIDDKDPPQSRAYKDFILVEAEVESLTWNESRYGLIKPIVNIYPVVVSGKTFTNVSGHNAEYIYENLIGPGAKIFIGINIIPIIKGVDVPAEDEIIEEEFDRLKELGYKFKGRELISIDSDSQEKRIQSILHFLKILEIERLKKGSLKKLFKAGYDTLFDILRLTEDEFKAVLGKNGVTIYNNIQKKWHTANDELLFLASGFFQRLGSKIINNLFDNITLIELIAGKRPQSVENFGPKRMEVLERGLPEFIQWIVRVPERRNIQERKRSVKTDDHTYVILTGDPPKLKYNNKKEFMNAHPELIETGKWKDVQLVICDHVESETAKSVKADTLGIKKISYIDYES